MKELIERINHMTDGDLREVMSAIERRYAAAYPDQNVIYIAIHKEPERRKREFSTILRMIGEDLTWNQENTNTITASEQ